MLAHQIADAGRWLLDAGEPLGGARLREGSNNGSNARFERLFEPLRDRGMLVGPLSWRSRELRRNG